MKYIQQVLIVFFLLLLHYAVFYTIPNQFSEQITMDDIRRIILNRKIYLLIIIVTSIISYIKYILKNQKLSDSNKATLFSIVLCFNIFYVVELYFCFKTKSHAVGYSYAGKLWSVKYWNPINANGFRDKTYQHNLNNKTIFFIGDSFTEGHGIENIEDRYSNIVKNKLPNYNVYNLGVNGLGTKKETEILTLAPIKPSIVFWQYFFNDIDELLPIYKYNFSFTPYNDISSLVQKVVKGSFFFNYIYWSQPHKDAQNYLDVLTEGIKNRALIKEHLQDCDAIINYCSNNNIKLVFIPFPLFVADEKNTYNVHTKFMSDYMSSKSVAVINVDSLTKDLKIEDKIVNNSDPHASIIVNKRVADYILKATGF